jgi:hypothetical protein
VDVSAVIAVYVGIALVVLFAFVLLLGLIRAAALDDRLMEAQLTELEVMSHIYPKGNVHLLDPPADEAHE